jgi:hypothetical protein
MAAPPTAVGQAGRLKNACRLLMHNSPMAGWLPGSTPAMPGTQVMARPRDLLPDVTILAVRPAASPGTTHAMTPVTGSFASDQAA